MHKNIPLPGVIRAEWVVFDKPTCRCATGSRHGPYLYRHWREDGRQRRAYVRPSEAECVRLATERWRQLHPLAYRLRQEPADLRRLLTSLEG